MSPAVFVTGTSIVGLVKFGSGVISKLGASSTKAEAQRPVPAGHPNVTIGISLKISPIFWPHLHSSIFTQVAHEPARAELKFTSPVVASMVAPVLPVPLGKGDEVVYPVFQVTAVPGHEVPAKGAAQT